MRVFGQGGGQRSVDEAGVERVGASRQELLILYADDGRRRVLIEQWRYHAVIGGNDVPTTS
jgi:hypothetical protein